MSFLDLNSYEKNWINKEAKFGKMSFDSIDQVHSKVKSEMWLQNNWLLDTY